MKIPSTLSILIEDYIIKNKNLELELLPIVHISNEEILRDHFLINFSLKPVNKIKYHNDEKLLFFFYGKASYIPSEHQLAGFDDDIAPIALIYSPNIFETINMHRLVCFDSGAYIDGRFSRDKKPQKTDSLNKFIKESPKIKHLKAAILAIYENNQNYFKNKIKPYFTEKEAKVSKCLNTIYKLASMKKSMKTDFGQQAFTFEIQVINEIKELPDVIALPSELFTSEDTIETIKETFHKSELIEYEYNTEFGIQINDAYSYMKKEVNNYIFNNYINKIF